MTYSDFMVSEFANIAYKYRKKFRFLGKLLYFESL